jgi:predicted metalloprotease
MTAMKWESDRRSDNVEDRRGSNVTRGAVGGGAVLLAIVAALLGAPEGTVRDILGGAGTVTEPSAPSGPADPAEEKAADFVKVVLGYTEETWHAVFAAHRKQYEEPKLQLFRRAVRSACGRAESAVGPFYCPPDHKVYLDLSFFAELDRRFGAPGDFAQAYVVAHEVGHHVQNLLGLSDAVHQRRSALPAAQGNKLSVMTELQADCYAGVWAYHTNKRSKQVIEPGDVEEGLRAAAAIGDDTLQRQARGQVVPESFTHGSSQQRVHWFKQGMATGKMESCDTFGTARL